MLAEIVFLTRFLGLASGEREVVLNADANVHRVEIFRDDRRIASLDAPPWRARIDLGEDLGPYQLTAVGFDARGAEVARDVQIINLVRLPAEVGLLLDRDGAALSARVLWTHIEGKTPSSIVVKFDGRVVRSGRKTTLVPLGSITDKAIHVVSAELTFPDGVEVRKEIIFGGIYSEQMPVELTPVAVRQREHTETRCITVGGRQVTPVAVERGKAMVAFVVNGDAGHSLLDLPEPPYVLSAEIRAVSPILKKGRGANYFPSVAVRVPRSTRRAVTMSSRELGSRGFAHAIAATGMGSLRNARRRAIVYAVGSQPQPDLSEMTPQAVTRYLQHIGVPLRVWSLTGPNPELEALWGPVQDVSSADKLAHATAELREELDSQRIAWLPAPPLDAYRAEASEDCAFVPLAVQ